jgi:hypothetical protein
MPESPRHEPNLPSFHESFSSGSPSTPSSGLVWKKLDPSNTIDENNNTHVFSEHIDNRQSSFGFELCGSSSFKHPLERHRRQSSSQRDSSE